VNTAIPPDDAEDDDGFWPAWIHTRWVLLASAVTSFVLLMAAAIGPWSLMDAIEGIVAVGLVTLLAVIAPVAWRSLR
jgi:hypothetical protein